MKNSDQEKAKAVNNEFNALSGLQFLRHQMALGENSPMGTLMNISVIAVEDGMVKLQAVPEAKFYNPMLRIHGGFAATLIDSALGSAVLSKLGVGVGVGTVALNVNYVRKIDVSTGAIVATANVLHAGRTMLTAEAKVHDSAGVLYAHGTGTFLVYPK